MAFHDPIHHPPAGDLTNPLVVWSPAEIELLRELANRLAPLSDEIARDWADQLVSRIGTPLAERDWVRRRILEVNRWFLEGHLLNLREGNISRVFQHNIEGDRALLRSQRELDPEARSTLSHLYLSFDLSTGAIVSRLRQIYRHDPRLPSILSVYGRLALLLGETIGLAFHEVASEDLREALRTVSSLLEAARELNTRTGSVAEVLRKLCRIVQALARCDQSVVFLWSEASQQYSAQAGAGFSAAEFQEIRKLRFRRGDFAMMDTILEGRMASGTFDDGKVPRELMERFGESVYAVAPMLDPDGRPLGTIAAYRTQRDPFGRTDLEILEGIARNAALAIENAMLVERLESSGRLKSEFVSAMSHELRTPLNSLIGYLDMLFDLYQGDQSGLDVMRRMQRSGHYLLKLVNNILDLKRIEAGEMPFQTDVVPLRELFHSLEDMFAATARERGIALSCVLPDYLGTIVTDRMKLQEVLNNLVANALKFTDGGGSVTVRAMPADVVGYLAFEVADTGIGIEEENVNSIFEMFRQGGLSGRGGAGLGLYLVKQLTDRLGGTVEVRSESGKGATFRVTLPIEPQNGPFRYGSTIS